ncbi:hypothetical protein, partial [Paenibacillus sp. SAFN-117]|uniref:hypothetical protein n=1 Tax=Paenibacillus sp. SAFN-117 TaxID=3436860 RepID=UPI003F7D0849
IWTLYSSIPGQATPSAFRHYALAETGFNTLSKMEVISPVMAIKAMEMKHKLTNGSAGGYTHYGLEEIKLREAGR